MNTKHTPAKTATKILHEHSIDVMQMSDEFNSQLLHAMERYAEQYAKEQNAELLEEEIKNLEFLKWVASKAREFNMWSDKVQELHERISKTESTITKATE